MKCTTFKFRSAMAVFVSLLCLATGALAHEIIYSPADSILYLEYLPSHPYLFRIRDGGARIERAVEEAPGNIVAFDAIPGHLYATDNDPYFSYKSSDYGEIWDPCETCPYYTIWGFNPFIGWCGEFPGQSQIFNDQWMYVTNDSWQTYDSIRINRWCPDAQDSIDLISPSYQVEQYYGLTRQNDLFCVTSDTGHTWATGSSCAMYDQARIGAVDEWWGRYGYRIILTLDTGRIVIDPVFTAQPPLRPYAWQLRLWPTDHPGEAYVVMYLDWWMSPPTTELIVYHILNYGAQVDSFYHRIVDFEIPDAASEPILPQQFSLSAYPNPFNTSINFEWVESSSGIATVMITDVLGRRVWDWSGSGNSILWSGQTANGNPAASGSYWVSVRRGLLTSNPKRVILLR